MWRYLEGVSNPEALSLNLKDHAAKRKYSADYEKNKRSRAFNSKWVQGRPWLDDTEHGMICRYCTDVGSRKTFFKKDSEFVSGCTSYKLDSITKHEKSKSHEQASLAFKARNSSKSESEAGKIIINLNKNIISKLDKMFRTCHALVLKNRPLSDFMWMCNLDEMKGLEIGNTYRNRFSATNFVEHIALIEFQQLTEQIRNAKFLTLIGDGSTDSSIKEQELWFVRFATQGQIKVKFVGVFSPEKANAENIVEGLKDIVSTNLLIEWPTFANKLVALSCDGASVMMGCRAGVGALLKNEQPCMLKVHCMGHRLELAIKDAVKNIKLYDKTINVLCMGLYFFYHYSPLNRAMLLRTSKALKDSEDPSSVLMPTRVGGTRWIGHTYRAISNLLTSYRYIVTHLEQLTETTEKVSNDSKAKAKAFLKLLRSKDIVCFLMFMMDLLAPLKRLSLLLQDQKCVVGNQYTCLSDTMDMIKKYKVSDGPYLRKIVDHDDKTTFEGVNLVSQGVIVFPSARLTIVDNIDSALSKRFSEFSCPSVIQATRIADLQRWPKMWESLKDFGDGDVKTLIDHFSSMLENPEGAEMEWTLLKKDVFETDFNNNKTPDWEQINNRNIDSLANILDVIDITLSLSPTSAEAERGFSQLKLIKTNLRSTIGQSNLNHCMAIKLLSCEIKDYDPALAINHWNNSSTRARRPNFKDVDCRNDHEGEMESISEIENEQIENVEECESEDDMNIVYEKLLAETITEH